MENNIKKVHLVLKHQWYDMIESGVKQEEYRNNTTRYQDMLNNFRIKKPSELPRGTTVHALILKAFKFLQKYNIFFNNNKKTFKTALEKIRKEESGEKRK